MCTAGVPGCHDATAEDAGAGGVDAEGGAAHHQTHSDSGGVVVVVEMVVTILV